MPTPSELLHEAGSETLKGLPEDATLAQAIIAAVNSKGGEVRDSVKGVFVSAYDRLEDK